MEDSFALSCCIWLRSVTVLEIGPDAIADAALLSSGKGAANGAETVVFWNGAAGDLKSPALKEVLVDDLELLF